MIALATFLSAFALGTSHSPLVTSSPHATASPAPPLPGDASPTPSQGETPDPSAPSWKDLRTRLEEAGLVFAGTFVHEWLKASSGGLDHGIGRSRFYDLSLTVDLERLARVSDARLFVDAYATAGGGITQEVGDFQVASNIESDRVHVLAEAWWEQRFGERLRIKLGKVDANTEFALVAGGAQFLNSSMGYSPTIFPLPTFPDPSYSVNADYQPSPESYLRVGLYDGAGATGLRTGNHGLGSFTGSPAALFAIVEAGNRWAVGQEQGAGRLGLGAWYLDATLPRFDGGTDSGARGAYLTLDQNLWADSEAGPGLDLFLQLGLADDSVSAAKSHVGVGAVLSGLGELESTVGLGASWVELSDDATAGFTSEYELALELFWELELSPWCTVQPDLQLIVNPGGDDRTEDALLAGARFIWSL